MRIVLLVILSQIPGIYNKLNKIQVKRHYHIFISIIIHSGVRYIYGGTYACLSPLSQATHVTGVPSETQIWSCFYVSR